MARHEGIRTALALGAVALLLGALLANRSPGPETGRVPAHWAFTPPERPGVPAVRDAAWPRDELDRFVLARLEAAGSGPAAEAGRETWIRRVSFDLTGLPPSLGEVDAFLADTGEGAHERVVARLLASPHHGEHMAAQWMDVARYADTYGYQNDAARRVWPWRDWVIRSFNANLPYDEFMTWQLAGDLLPAPTRDQRLATAFNRLHRQTNEGGSTEEEYRVEYVSDRVHTFGMAFMGLTLECARCHDHKFDPVRKEEYYGLAAFFDNIDESGLYSHFTSGVPTPTLLLTDAESDGRIADLDARIAQAEATLSGLEVPAFRLQGRSARFALDEPLEGERGPRAIPGRFDGALEFSGEDNATFPGVGEFRRWDAFSFSLWVRTPERPEHVERAVVLHRSRAWTDAASCGYQLLLEDGRPSFALIHFWPGDALCVRALEPVPAGKWVHLAVTYDGSSRADGLTLYRDGRAVESEVVRDHLTKDIVSGGELVLTLAQRFRDRGFAGGGIDELQVFERCLTPAEVELLGRSTEPGEPAGVDDVAWRAAQSDLRALREELGRLVDSTPEIMTMVEMPAPRPTFALVRGSYAERGKQVAPHTPAVLGAFPAALLANRLGLAQWLTAPDHPLTARVAVNRLWQQVFGEGLVRTPEDFGSQGAPPTHPELLDYLALELVAADWDLRAILTRLVLSSTYRQSSRATTAARAADPENRLLARAPSHRLSAEQVRDAALFASGLLVDTIGGPSVKPYQPPGLWEEKSGQAYAQDEGAGLWRRSLYGYWKRTSPPPSMMIFDAGTREVCSARRQPTSTPLQALVLMNDPQYVEAARALAGRVLREADEGVDARLEHGFRLLATRRPTGEELRVLRALFDAQLADFREHPEEARALLGVGAAPLEETPDPADPADPAEHAAYAVVASTLMNYDAVLVKR